MTRYRTSVRRRWFGFWFALATFQVVSASAHPSLADEVDVDFEFAPRRMRQQCYGPATWSQIASCLKQTSPTLVIGPRPTTHTQFVFDKTSPLPGGGFLTRMYVQHLDGKWSMMRTLGAGSTVAGEKLMPVEGSKRGAIRVELREQALFANGAVRGLFRMKSAIVCQLESCVELVYDCAYLENGRGKYMLMGSLVSKSAGVVAVEADRTLAIGQCSR